MAEGKKQNTVSIAEQIILPVLKEMGATLWDVRFEKEGATWYLRYFVDKEGGITINDLTDISRAVDKLLDAADPIDQSYTLEVCSPGIERKLIKDHHFQQYIGYLVNVRLIRPVEGIRDFTGKLIKKDGDNIHILIDTEDEIEMVFTLKETAYVRLFADFGTGGTK